MAQLTLGKYIYSANCTIVKYLNSSKLYHHVLTLEGLNIKIIKKYDFYANNKLLNS